MKNDFPACDKKYMRRALALAKRAEGQTYPNPMVGAVVVKDGKVIAEAYHEKSGEPHAEVLAIRDASGPLKGATLYVTLEPCDHQGKTPPCTEAIIESGISKVKIACLDTAKHNSGKGFSRLKRAGISVERGILEQEAREINRQYFKFIEKAIPYVTLKSAQTLDGKVSAEDGSSKWITSEETRLYAYRRRSRYSALIVGINTVLLDNPFLLDKGRGEVSFARIILDSTLRVPLDCNIVKTSRFSRVIVATTQKADEAKITSLRNNGVEVLVLPEENSRVCIKSLLKKLAHNKMLSVLVEGGGEVCGAFLDHGCVDEFEIYIAPKLLGKGRSSFSRPSVRNIKEAIELHDSRIIEIGPDILVQAKIKKTE